MTPGSAITSLSASERFTFAKTRFVAALAACLALASVGGARPAFAADSAQKAACLRSSEEGQRLRAAGRLREARVSFLVCAKDQCPAVVRDDCAQWTSEVTEGMPSVVFAARDQDGHPITNVSVEVDGEVLATHLDGTPLLLDPGEHHMRFAHQGSRSAEQTVTLTKGEKKRLLTIELEAPSGAPSEPEPPRPTPVLVTQTTTGVPVAPAPGPKGAARYAGPIAFGGAGVVALGIGTYLLVHASSDVSTLEGSCSPYCGHDAVDRLRTRALAGDILLGVGATSVLAAGYLYFFTQPRSAEAPRRSARSVDFDVAPGVHGGEALLRGTF